MNIYEELGIKKLINAAGTYTAVGASKMCSETLNAMMQSSQDYVSIEKLLESVNQKIAHMTHNEAAFVCNSCSTALYLTAAAFVAKKYNKPFKYIKKGQVEQCEMIAFWNQHIPYDHAIEQLGVKLNFIGDTTPTGGMEREKLHMAIGENTVGIYFAPRTPLGYYSPKHLNLADVIDVAHEHGIPVLVDAAAQLPPKSNLWEYTQIGADVVTFSGGKDLAGPQASGLALGKQEYLSIISETGFPNYSAGRIMKIGREEIVGLYVALKHYLQGDEEARKNWCEEQIEELKNGLKNSNLFSVTRCWPNQAGQPLPRAFVSINDTGLINGEALAEELMEYEPGIYAITEGKNGVYINPMCMCEGEIEIVISCLSKIERSF